MELSEVKEYLNSQQKNMTDLVYKLAEINSGSYNLVGLGKVANILRSEYAALNCEYINMPVAPASIINHKGDKEEFQLGPALRFCMRPDAPMQVLLVGHMDTVYDKDHKFQRVHQTGGDILHGPGVADMKSGLAIMLYALKAFEQLPNKNKLGWEVLLTSDEEIGSPGSAEILAYRAKKHKIGLVFEPAMDDTGTLAGARKGNGKFSFVLRGRAAHAGRSFNEGRNAIYKMAEIITQVNALNGKREDVTINAGVIHGGEALNIVADCCVAKFDVRVPHSSDAEWVQNNFNQIIESITPDSGFRVELLGSFDRKPKIIDAQTEKLFNLVKTVGKSLGLEINWRPSGGCSDGNNLSAAGLPNVDTLGARGGKIHSEQEYIIIPSLVERANLTTNLLFNLGENGF